jgi:hypothetical protein
MREGMENWQRLGVILFLDKKVMQVKAGPLLAQSLVVYSSSVMATLEAFSVWKICQTSVYFQMQCHVRLWRATLHDGPIG